MYVERRSLLSRLLRMAWTVLLIAVLLSLAVHLLAKIWVWVVAVGVVSALVWVAVRLRRLRREMW